MHFPAIEVSGVWKSFRRGERHDSLRDLMPAAATRLLHRRPAAGATDNRFWAVEDVSFKVHRGEALGIIGPNGSGKSTMLKLLTRILRPTRGTLVTHGRVGALIEVGAAFHPDLTGRENIFLQGAIYGMRADEISARFDSIVDFAGVREFVDTPVKRYSSGMQARLGFSVAAHLEPDVLLIDEVLAVGDAAFQSKCIERMKAFKHAGTAIVFVSHNLQAVSELCDRTLYLHRSIKAEGGSDEVIASYLSSVRGHASFTKHDNLSILNVRLVDPLRSTEPDAIPAGHPLVLEVEYRAETLMPSDLTFGFDVYRSTDSMRVSSTTFHATDLGVPAMRPHGIVRLRFAFAAHLTGGQYHIALDVFGHDRSDPFAALSPAAIFHVKEARSVVGISDLAVRPQVITRT